MPKNHWMMFGTFAEQRHFIYPSQDTYEGIFINANMAAHAPDGIAKFIQTKTDQQKYIIDPQTHAFQHLPKYLMVDIIDKETGKRTGEMKLKQSFQKLVVHYGNPVDEMAGIKPVKPATFSDDVLTEFGQRCLDFQRNFISSRMAESEDSKYTSFESEDEQTLAPYALIPPYFYMQETTFESWLPVNIKSINLALASKASNEKFFAMLVLNQGMLTNSTALETVVDAYSETPLDGYVIWIDDLAEFEAGSVELAGLLDLAHRLNAHGDKEVINLHGSYFSVLATSPKWEKPSLTGVCHGPEFGERRSVVPVGGGIPIARYYIPSLHQRVRYREALPILSSMGHLGSSEAFHDNVCNCIECKKNIDGDPSNNFTLYGISKASKRKTKHGVINIDYPTTETKLRCLRHYLQRKNIEYEFANTAALSQIKSDLKGGTEEFVDVIGEDGVEHLKLWEQVLFECLQ